MAFQNAIIQGLQGQGEATSYYFEAYRDVRVNQVNAPNGLTFVMSCDIKDNYTYNYSSDTWLLGNSQWGIKLDVTSGNIWYVGFYLNGNMITDITIDVGGTSTSYVGNEFYHISIMVGIDNTNQKGTIFILGKQYSTYSRSTYYWQANYSNTLINSTAAYNWIIGHIVLPYNWQSVSSISGKNGILSLAQIKEEYINDGESVSGASADHFTNLSTENRVDVLINSALPDPETGGTTVTVEYTIPSLSIGSYEYCKLVAKKNSIPESSEDGDKIIDINPSSNSIVVRGLDELSTYYFVIFIEDDQGNTASSEPKSCETGEKTTIDFFTDSFNSDLMKDGWNLSNIKGGWGSGNDGWNPSQYSDFFLSSWNFLMGNSGKKPIVLVDGTLRRSEYSTAAGDCIFWIPINRVNGELKGLEWDYCNIRPRGGSYDAIGIIIGWVDSNNGWHQYTVGWIDNLHDTNWHHGEYTNLSPQNTHIDYIGIYTCDGQPACKNIILTVL